MHELTVLFDAVKAYGSSALIFVVWYLYHRSQVSTFKNIIDNNFQLLSGLLESIQYQSSQLAKISEQISANQYCPLMRKQYISPEHRKEFTAK